MTEVASSSSSSLRSLFPRLFSKAPSKDGLETLQRTVRKQHPKADVGLLERTYRVAEKAHQGQIRMSGEPYITHPLAVAQILAELGIGPI
ncbi:MAG: bifunctional (p)ppGpp synthetase/guanosine-3',5'-bis(diphosphate) 3'-pyrophosphohydrolase, partial [Microbacteriaceae bacterium]|nr:bifunctional (p)ppGpp synthetase/guanosine-3',5'-bis(diphosphate) 3'-pyrophosphohydrolase [Microbacteriaceae bacterium]